MDSSDDYSFKDFLDSHDASLFRMICLLNHYRAGIEYNEELLEKSRNALASIKSFINAPLDKSVDFSSSFTDQDEVLSEKYTTITFYLLASVGLKNSGRMLSIRYVMTLILRALSAL